MATRRKVAFIVISILVILLIVGIASYLYLKPKTTSSQETRTSRVELIVGGATFPYYQIERWINLFTRKYPNITIVYNPVGSGKGIANFKAGLYVIAFHDPPLPPKDWEEITRMYGPVLQCPTVAGAVVIIYNIPGIRGTLNLTGQLLADIFMGKVKDWCSPKVLEYNPGLRPVCSKIRRAPITVVVRHEASGTTLIFTTYLSIISREFNKTVGAGFLPHWSRAWNKYGAHGVEAKGNFGVAETVRKTPFSIGYVEWSYAIFTNLTTAAVQNPLGEFVKPTRESILKALEGAIRQGVLQKYNPLSNLFREGEVAWFLNVKARGAYPIVALSHLTVRLHYSKTELPVAVAVYRFLKFIWVGPYSNSTIKGYLPVPYKLRERCFDALRRNMLVDGTPVRDIVHN